MILEHQDRIRQLEMERNEQIRQNQQNLENCDTAKSRGNSLFSEVEERRVKGISLYLNRISIYSLRYNYYLKKYSYSGR
jgi:hypothetical protein